jgi:hypothetical protein
VIAAANFANYHGKFVSQGTVHSYTRQMSIEMWGIPIILQSSVILFYVCSERLICAHSFKTTENRTHVRVTV